MKKILIFLVICLLMPGYVLAQEPNLTAEQPIPEPIIRPSVRIINSETFSLEKEFYPFDETSTVEGLNIATADLNKDGKKEIIVAAGRNEKPLIKIFNYQGEFLYQFLAFDENSRMGFKVIAADLYKDGSPEIIVAPNIGGGPQIRVFDNLGFHYFSFFAFDENLRGGASVAVGDINGDTQNEIIVGAGYGQEPKIKIFDNYSNYIIDFLAYESTFTGGVNVLAANLDNEDAEEIIAAPALGKAPKVRIFNKSLTLLKEFIAYPLGFWGGVNLAKGDIDDDGNLEILTGAGFGGGAHLRIFDSQGNAKKDPKFFVYEDFRGGISIANDDLDNDNQAEILAATQTISPLNKYNNYKFIEIDLEAQKLYTYFMGQIDNEYWVSTGTWKYPTPKGTFRIYNKMASTRMRGYYGPKHPDNYDLANVPWNLPFYKGYMIHGAYWHHNFGHRMSHGCVNMSVKQAKEVYDWADIGIPVIVF